jgi:quinol monooxygenase YgiN
VYVRTLTLQLLPGEDETLRDRLQEELLPALRRQAGFVDYLGMFAADDPDLYVAMMFWETRAHAEQYAHSAHPQMIARLRALLAAPAEVNDFEVDTSTYGFLAREIAIRAASAD